MRCAGRPPIGNKPLNRVNVMLSDEDMKRVRSLGNGSISAGLRTALGCANAYGRKPRDTQTKSEQQADTIIEKQRVKIEELKTKLEQRSATLPSPPFGMRLRNPELCRSSYSSKRMACMHRIGWCVVTSLLGPRQVEAAAGAKWKNSIVFSCG